jgi:hypothetical protein
MNSNKLKKKLKNILNAKENKKSNDLNGLNFKIGISFSINGITFRSITEIASYSYVDESTNGIVFDSKLEDNDIVKVNRLSKDGVMLNELK